MNTPAQREYWVVRVTFYDDDENPVPYWFRDWEAGSTVPEYTPLTTERFAFADHDEAMVTCKQIRKLDKALVPLVVHVNVKRRRP